MASYLPRFLHRYPVATIHYRWPGGRSLDPTSSPSPPPPGEGDEPHRPLHWPTPIHDVLAAYDFLLRALSPPPHPSSPPSPSTDGKPGLKPPSRDLYLYGTHLGAGLAASLALTESHAHAPVAVRGLLALDGVYNWTTFLPDHPINRSRAALVDESLGLGPGGFDDVLAGDAVDLGRMRALMPRLFQQPANLFDPFASPVLFFHTAGILAPRGFHERWRPSYLSSDGSSRSSSPSSTGASGDDSALDIDPYDYVYSDPEDPPPPAPYPEEAETADDAGALNFDADATALRHPGLEPDPALAIAPPPRRGYLAFPPRQSTLRIPPTLLLHSTPPPLPTLPPPLAGGQRRRTALWKRLRNAENSFGSQAAGLAGLMRRSVVKMEARERRRWDEEAWDGEGEALRRVVTEDVGRAGAGGHGEEVEIGERAEEVARQWLEDRLG